MKFIEKLQVVVLPALFIIGLGVLAVKFPHAMEGLANDNYTGSGGAGAVLLIFEFFLWLTWGKIGGVIGILLGVTMIVTCFLPKKSKAVR